MRSAASSHSYRADHLVGVGQYHRAVAGGYEVIVWLSRRSCAPTRYREVVLTRSHEDGEIMG
jgi:hypothetical protein